MKVQSDDELLKSPENPFHSKYSGVIVLLWNDKY